MDNKTIYSDEFLNAKRLEGDPDADNFISQVFSDQVKKQHLQKWISTAYGKASLKELENKYPDLFITRAGTLPLWAEQSEMKTGADFFAKHSEIIMSLLGLLSLPYCYTAANGAMVLYLSELIRKQTTKRLYDTAIFVWEVLGPDAFTEEGNAYTQIFKVRLMHAAVRYYTLKSGKWDDTWGLPINQEDMAGTNLSFSLIVIRGLRLLGYNVSQKDQEAFLHTWAAIGYLTGLQFDMIPKTSKMAQDLDMAIKERQFITSDHGVELTKSLTNHIKAINKSKASNAEILGLMRYLLGSEIAGMLAINAPELPSYKITLIRSLNLFKGFKLHGDLEIEYRRAYLAFKQQNHELNKMNE